MNDNSPKKITSEGLGIKYSELVKYTRTLKSNHYSKDDRRDYLCELLQFHQNMQIWNVRRDYLCELLQNHENTQPKWDSNAHIYLLGLTHYAELRPMNEPPDPDIFRRINNKINKANLSAQI